MLAKRISFDLPAIDPDGIVEDATGDLDGVALTLIATGPGGGVDAAQMAFVASGDISSATFDVLGKDADGRVQSETVTGITTSPVETSKYYSEITSITGNDDISSATLDVGFVDECVSRTIPLDPGSSFAIHQDESGTLELDVQLAMGPVPYGRDQEDIDWQLHDAQLDDFLNTERFVIASGYTAARLKINSYSAGASVEVFINQG